MQELASITYYFHQYFQIQTFDTQKAKTQKSDLKGGHSWSSHVWERATVSKIPENEDSKLSTEDSELWDKRVLHSLDMLNKIESYEWDTLIVSFQAHEFPSAKDISAIWKTKIRTMKWERKAWSWEIKMTIFNNLYMTHMKRVIWGEYYDCDALYFL